jgi:Rrf2 family protein
MAAVGSGSAVLAGEIAEAIKVPESYLRKVFQLLVRSRIVVSRRGAKGGFSLGRGAGEITLRDVVEAIDGSLPVYSCLKAVRNCSGSAVCLVSEIFAKARKSMEKVLEATSIEDLVHGISKRSAQWLKVTECA